MNLANAIAKIESSNNLNAMRFEPRVFAQPTSELQTIPIIAQYATGGWMDDITAQVIGATSWGQFQIMGYNIYKHFQGTLVEFLYNRTLQEHAFESFVTDIGFNSLLLRANIKTIPHQTLLEFSAKYNGDGPAYSAALLMAAG